MKSSASQISGKSVLHEVNLEKLGQREQRHIYILKYVLTVCLGVVARAVWRVT